MEILIIGVSYLVGAIPFGLLIGKLAGKDVRRSGSKNIGATNVTRLLGKKLGFFTLVCDLAKGFGPVVLVSWLFRGQDVQAEMIAFCGLAAVVGHMYPVYLGFKGGKGVATGLGVFLFLSPAAIGISLVVFITSVMFSGFVSVGSLAASGLIPLWLFLLDTSPVFIWLAVGMAVLVWFKHRDNIRRLLKGEEKSWRKKKESA